MFIRGLEHESKGGGGEAGPFVPMLTSIKESSTSTLCESMTFRGSQLFKGSFMEAASCCAVEPVAVTHI